MGWRGAKSSKRAVFPHLHSIKWRANWAKSLIAHHLPNQRLNPINLISYYPVSLTKCAGDLSLRYHLGSPGWADDLIQAVNQDPVVA